jgi:hypothetical protein
MLNEIYSIPNILADLLFGHVIFGLLLLLLEKPGLGGIRQKNLQNLDSMREAENKESYMLLSWLS